MTAPEGHSDTQVTTQPLEFLISKNPAPEKGWGSLFPTAKPKLAYSMPGLKAMHGHPAHVQFQGETPWCLSAPCPQLVQLPSPPGGMTCTPVLREKETLTDVRMLKALGQAIPPWKLWQKQPLPPDH